MHEMKDTARALVRIGYDSRVYKTFRGHQAKERFDPNGIFTSAISLPNTKSKAA